MDYAVLKKNFENHRFHTSYFETTEEGLSGEAGLGAGTDQGRESRLWRLYHRKRDESL